MFLAVLVRGSTGEQETVRQIFELRAVAEVNDWEVVEVIEETISGAAVESDRQRPGTGLPEDGGKILVHGKSWRLAILARPADRDFVTVWKRNPAAAIMFSLFGRDGEVGTGDTVWPSPVGEAPLPIVIGGPNNVTGPILGILTKLYPVVSSVPDLQKPSSHRSRPSFKEALSQFHSFSRLAWSLRLAAPFYYRLTPSIFLILDASLESSKPTQMPDLAFF